jgi:lysophospholipase L1-like esterase
VTALPNEPAAGPQNSPTPSNRFTATRARRLVSGILAGLVLAAIVELILQVVDPRILDQIRWRHARVRWDPASFITLQADNYEPATGEGLMVFDPELFWRMRPGMKGRFWSTPEVETNRLGLRCGPIDRKKPPRTVRLLFLGDSTTFGFRVSAADRYSERLSELLSRRYADVAFEVANAGCVGYSSFQGALLLRRLRDRLRPDCVFFCFGVNDGFRDVASDRDRYAEGSSATARFRLALRESQLFCALEGAIGLVKRELNRRETGVKMPVASFIYYPDTHRLGRGFAGFRNSPREFLENVAEADRLCRDAGIPLVLVAQAARSEYPIPAPQFDRTFLERVNAKVLRLAARRRIPVASMTRARARGDLGEDEFFADYCHPTPAGHRLLAEEILDEMDAAGTLLPELVERASG